MDPALALEVAGLARQKTVEEAIERGDSNVQMFYENAVVLVTGGSGFVGKQLVEKLLRGCPKIKRIYLLLRPKKGKDIKKRLDEVLADPVYNALRKKDPQFMKKMTAIQGDTAEIALGICDEDRKIIKREVNVIFHAAATTRFDDTLKHATITNVRGTKEMLSLAKECKELRSFVHISTAFSNGRKNNLKCEVYEKFYPSPIDPHLLINMVENIDDKILLDITPRFTNNYPNTYTYSKAVAEELVRAESKNLPICVVRPTIVISTYNEPAPGWLDMSCVFGATAMILGPALGVIHVVIVDTDIRADLVPLDLLNNLHIVTAYETARRYKSGNREAKIYTFSSDRNHSTYGSLTKIIRTELTKIPTPKCIYHCGAIVTKHLLVGYILFWLLHFIPGYFIDGCLSLFGKQPM